MSRDLISNIEFEYQRHKNIARRSIDQISDEALNRTIDNDPNSIAVIIRHVGGNLVSRFTDFLTSDGEKPWRGRDGEFESRRYTREEVLANWDHGWSVLESELAKLTDDDLQRTVTIRGESMTVHAALARSLAHTAYHVGQIALLSRAFHGEGWQWITLPRAQ